MNKFRLLTALLVGTICFPAAAQAPVFQINAGMNDTWFNPATAGQGFFITVFPDIDKMFLAWFTYDKQRPPQDVTAMLGEPAIAGSLHLVIIPRIPPRWTWS